MTTTTTATSGTRTAARTRWRTDYTHVEPWWDTTRTASLPPMSAVSSTEPTAS